jgi:CheY-like chemotaxis protein
LNIAAPIVWRRQFAPHRPGVAKHVAFFSAGFWYDPRRAGLFGPKTMLLVVDDDADVRAGMIRLLAALGYKAVGSGSGEDALAQMRARKPHLVIVDYMMPGMNGLDVLLAIKGDHALRDLPVILVSAADDPIHEAAMRAGASACMVKGSLNITQFEKELARLIRPT